MRWGLVILLLLVARGASAASLPASQAELWMSSTIVTLADGTKYRSRAPVVTVSCVDPATDLKFLPVRGRPAGFCGLLMRADSLSCRRAVMDRWARRRLRPV